MERQKTAVTAPSSTMVSAAECGNKYAESITASERDFRLFAPCMFLFSGLFIVLLAVLIVVWVDVPRVAELYSLEQPDLAPALAPVLSSTSIQSFPRADAVGDTVQWLLFIIWPLFWLEYLFNCIRTVKRGGSWPWNGLLCCIVPPLRMAAPNTALGGRIWLPSMHWQTPGRVLSRRLERIFSKPMLFIGLLILPILLIEYGLQGLVKESPGLQSSLHAATGFIWCAFTIEFIIMYNATDRKLRYINAHRIDLIIILLPLVSFLRSLQILRLANMAHVQKLAKMGRVFRMRGLLMRTMRALMLLKIANRLFKYSPEKKLAGLKLDLEEKLEEIEELQLEINQLETEIATRTQPAESALQEAGIEKL